VTGAQLAVFATLVAILGGVWVTLFFLLPLNARATFQYRATVLRDECLDAVFNGRLRRTAPVEWFLERAGAMAERPELFSLTRALAVHQAMVELGCDGEERPSHASLKPEESELLDRLDHQLDRALVQRLVLGSSFGWLFWLTSKLRSLVPRANRDPGTVSVPPPQHLAREDFGVSEKVPIRGRKLISLSH